MTVRTRLTTATFTVACLDGAAHRFTATRTGTISNPHHDPDEDAVIAALGGLGHPCAVAANSLSAALVCFDALTGTRDVPGLRQRNRGIWTDGHDCPTCPTGDARHLASPAHQAHRFATSIADTTTLLRWLIRTSSLPVVAPCPTRPRSRSRIDPVLVASLNARDASEHAWALGRALITPGYVDAAEPFVGRNAEAVLSLRGRGTRVEWLRTLHRHARASAIHYAREHNPRLPTTLAAARNVPARAVADYLNAGITAHFHTYDKAHAHPHQVLAVYRATNGATSLADLLATGLTVHQALHQVGAR